MSAKEILDYLKDEELYSTINGIKQKMLYQNEADELLDYITNLQEENERLKEEKENLTHIVANKIIKDYDIDTPLKNQLIDERSKYISLSDVCHDYKSRCEKAMEYIKENKDKYYHDWGEDDGSYDTYLDETEIDKLSNILNGGDEE